MTSEGTTEMTPGPIFRRLRHGEPPVPSTQEQPKRSGRHTTGFDGKYQVLGDAELTNDEEAELEHQLATLEEDPSIPVSTALRWRKAQLDLVRRAARLAGVPYQAYLKQAVIRSALADLRAAREAGVETD